MTKLLLSVVEDTFQLSGRRGIVVAPGIPRDGDWRIKVGDPVVLERPDGTSIETAISGIEMLSPANKISIPILLGVTAKSDVPIGTKIWVRA